MFKSFAIIALLFQAAVTTAEDRTTIGVQTALSGGASTYGLDIRDGLLFANEDLGGGRYNFIFEDDRCDPKTAISAARKLVDVDKVKYVLGVACSGALLAAAPIYESAKVLTISPSASAAQVSNAGKYIYRTWLSDKMAASKLYGFIVNRHKKLGIVTEETEYAQGFLDGFSANSSGSHLEIENEFFQTAETDFRSLLLRLKNKTIDGLFLNTQTELTFLAALKQVRELKISLPIYSAYWGAAAEFLKTSGALANGVLVVDAPLADDLVNNEGKELLARFKKKYGNPRYGDILVLTSYEAFRAMKMAIECGSDSLKYLDSATFKGSFGDWSFDQNGDLAGFSFVLKVIRDSRAERLQEK